MRAEDCIRRFSMEQHIENGCFVENHYPADGTERAASGSIYYYVAPGEHTAFHRIDCDEYWCFNAGETLELWVIGTDGQLRIRHCGIENGAEPMIRFAAGEIFASRLPKDAPDGCLVTCITVPRFTYDGFTMSSQQDMIDRCPDTANFFED